MNGKSILFAGLAVAALCGAASVTALADHYGSGTRVRYDDQADQTRALNNAALEQAREQSESQSTRRNDGDSDDAPAVVPADDRDPRDNRDDRDRTFRSYKDGVTN